MTINVLGNRSALAEAKPESLAIGEADREIFNCPSCGRPLAVGVFRCHSCGTRLVLEVRLQRASLFVGLGLAVGLLAGAGSVAGAALMNDRLGSAALAVPWVVDPVQPGASVVPGGGPLASATPEPTAPPIAVSALRQTASVNARLVAGGDDLRALALDPDFDPNRVAHVLRDLASQAVVGMTLVSRLDVWTDADPVAENLAELYSRVRVAAREGLSASLHNAPAYRAAAAEMLAVLDGLPAVDAASRELALSIDVELPPVLGPEGSPQP